ncbi:MAG: hypothetical protein JXB04_02995 [Kiritimatiellae bacterium]|nr:hypothetical protein [Kiritimatiellia bacterium]
MSRFKFGLVVVAVLAAVLGAAAGYLVNTSFEEEFGEREDLNMWGDYGEAFGECYQVYVNREDAPKKANSGGRILLINVPQNTWNGIWQQIPWDPETPFAWKAHFLIRGGGLGEGTATFMKTEFFDAEDKHLGDVSGTQHRDDTGGQWVLDTLRGTTPPGTASIRFVLIAGNNPDGETIQNRIYWDDADTME